MHHSGVTDLINTFLHAICMNGVMVAGMHVRTWHSKS